MALLGRKTPANTPPFTPHDGASAPFFTRMAFLNSVQLSPTQHPLQPTLYQKKEPPVSHETPTDTQTPRTGAEFRTLRLTVWVGMIAFLILAGYGFYLVYNLTQSVAHLNDSVATIANNMTTMTEAVNNNLNTMNHSFTTVANEMSQMRGDTNALAANLAQVTQTMAAMNQSILYLRQDVGQMNQAVGRPMSFFSQFMPQNAPPPPPPPMYYPAR